MMATNTDEDLIMPHEVVAADSALEKNATYPCPDFTIAHQQNASAIPPPILNGLAHLPRISTPWAWIWMYSRWQHDHYLNCGALILLIHQCFGRQLTNS